MWFSTELAKATPILIPTYVYILDRINALHQNAHPKGAALHQLIAIDLTLMMLCVYKLMKPHLPGKAS